MQPRPARPYGFILTFFAAFLKADDLPYLLEISTRAIPKHGATSDKIAQTDWRRFSDDHVSEETGTYGAGVSDVLLKIGNAQDIKISWRGEVLYAGRDLFHREVHGGINSALHSRRR